MQRLIPFLSRWIHSKMMGQNLTLILSLRQVPILVVAVVAADVSLSIVAAILRDLVEDNLIVVVISYLADLTLTTASAVADAVREMKFHRLRSIAAD